MGFILTPIYDECEFSSVAVQWWDGKILAAGTATLGSRSFAVVVRYNTDGSLDLEF